VSAPTHGVSVRTAEDLNAGRLAYETFAAAVIDWLPQPPEWTALSVHVQNGWIAVAKRLRTS
jgi:hypothetical protein